MKATRSLRQELERVAEESVSAVLVLNRGAGRVVFTMGTPTQAFYQDDTGQLVNAEALGAFRDRLLRPIRVAWAKWDLEEARGPALDDGFTLNDLALLLLGPGPTAPSPPPAYDGWEAQDADGTPAAQLGFLLPPLTELALAEGPTSALDLGGLAKAHPALLTVTTAGAALEQGWGMALFAEGAVRDAVWCLGDVITRGKPGWQATLAGPDATTSVYAVPEEWLRAVRQLWRAPLWSPALHGEWLSAADLWTALQAGTELTGIVIQEGETWGVALALPGAEPICYSTGDLEPTSEVEALSDLLIEGARVWLLSDGSLTAPDPVAAADLHRGVPVAPPVQPLSLPVADDFGVGAWLDEVASDEAAVPPPPPPPPPPALVPPTEVAAPQPAVPARNPQFPFSARRAAQSAAAGGQGSVVGWQSANDDFLHRTAAAEEEVIFEGEPVSVAALDLDWDRLLESLASIARRYLDERAQPVVDVIRESPRSSAGVRETIKRVATLDIDGQTPDARKAMTRQMSFMAAEYCGG
jgi:hypothetical protein